MEQKVRQTRAKRLKKTSKKRVRNFSFNLIVALTRETLSATTAKRLVTLLENARKEEDLDQDQMAEEVIEEIEEITEIEETPEEDQDLTPTETEEEETIEDQDLIQEEESRALPDQMTEEETEMEARPEREEMKTQVHLQRDK